MRISALVTTYRRFDLCCRAIDSILAQTVPVEEIVVVDNGSPEPEYLGLASLYEAAPVPVNVVRLSRGTHTQPPLRDDQGREIDTACRDTTNVALGLARGDWFAICHDDDCWMPRRIERQVEALHHNPGCLLIGANVVNVNPAGESVGIHHDYYGAHGEAAAWCCRDVTGCLPHFNPLAVSSLLFSRSLVQAIGRWQEWLPGPTGAHFRSLSASDWDFYARASRVTRILRVDEPLAFYSIDNVKHEGHEVHAVHA